MISVCSRSFGYQSVILTVMRTRENETRSLAFLLLVIAVVVASTLKSLASSPYCTPKNGRDRIQKAGACPTGYFASGDCCEALHKETPNAIPKIRGAACPSGYFASGGSCKAFR